MKKNLIRALVLLLALAVIGGSIFVCFMPPGRADTPAAEKFVTLQKGDSGAAIQEMQRALQALGYYDGPLDGNFSKKFEAAVRAFQQDFDLTENGKIDGELYALLAEEASAAPQAAAPAPSAPAGSEPFVTKGEWYSDQEHVAAYLRAFGTLPENYLTKKEAQALGWVNSEGNLWKVAPGKSIGGDFFGNYEGLLPAKSGRKYYECDLDFDGGYRNGKRIIFSSDGLIFYTEDHYESFEEIKP